MRLQLSSKLYKKNKVSTSRKGSEMFIFFVHSHPLIPASVIPKGEDLSGHVPASKRTTYLRVYQNRLRTFYLFLQCTRGHVLIARTLKYADIANARQRQCLLAHGDTRPGGYLLQWQGWSYSAGLRKAGRAMPGSRCC